jgi:hypothetical protein
MKDYFRVPSAIWDNETFMCLGVQAKLLYLLLIRLESRFGPWFYQTDKHLAQALRCSVPTVERARTVLAAVGFIDRKVGRKGKATTYRVVPQPWWV